MGDAKQIMRCRAQAQLTGDRAVVGVGAQFPSSSAAGLDACLDLDGSAMNLQGASCPGGRAADDKTGAPSPTLFQLFRGTLALGRIGIYPFIRRTWI